MKNVQITQELFWAIIKYHLAGQEQMVQAEENCRN